MDSFKDISRPTRIAVGALWIWLGVKALFGVLDFYAASIATAPLPPVVEGATMIAAVLYLVTLLATLFLVGRWIYRASANAHAIGGDLTVSPGMAVGWYFVPFANLVKPFRAMKEIWLVSHYGSDWSRGDASDLLNWWWGLWVLTNIVDNIDLRAGDALPGLSLAAALLNIPLSLILMRLMRQIRDGQNMVRHVEVFA